MKRAAGVSGSGRGCLIGGGGSCPVRSVKEEHALRRRYCAPMAFLTAPTWSDSHNVLTAHPELVELGAEMIDMMLTDPHHGYPTMTRADAGTTIEDAQGCAAAMQVPRTSAHVG